MPRNPEYQFVDTSVDALVSLLIASYERLSGQTVQPASPERVFIQWAASIVAHERVLNNYTGNQNIPSRAEGENLDALAELMYLPRRPQAQAAGCMQRFHISEPQKSAILVPKGTRVTSPGGLIWETVEDV
ncbi:MAG: phage baseplate protein, partial [Acutalibacter sp.]|nr:phage baseplate protein [Acutalibacter sp.]